MSVTCPQCGTVLEQRYTRCPQCGGRIPRYRDPNAQLQRSSVSRAQGASSRGAASAGARRASQQPIAPNPSRRVAQAKGTRNARTQDAGTSGSFEDSLAQRFQPNAAVPLQAANRPQHGTVNKRYRRESYLGVFLGIVVTALLVGVVILGVRTRGFGVFAEFEDRPSNLPGAPETPVDVIAQLDKPLASQTEEAPASARTFGVEAKGTLGEYGWDELALIAAEIEVAGARADGIDIAHHYNLVEADGTPYAGTKRVLLSEGVEVPVRLADVLHDDKADGSGKAGLTFVCAELPYARKLRETSTNQGGWEASELRAWLNNDVYNTVQEDLRYFIVPVLKRTNNAGLNVDANTVTDTQDHLWIPSSVEVGGKVSYQWTDAANKDAYDAVLNAEGYQYACYVNEVQNNVGANEGLMLYYKGDSLAWWLRSPSPSVSNHYRNVDNLGDPSWYEDPTYELGVCIGFCL